MPDDAPLARLAALERAYDGPVPEPERQLARFGSAAAVAHLAAAGNAVFYRAMVRRQIATIRRRRAEGSLYPALLADLGLYRARWRFWRRKAALAAGVIAHAARQ
jgi:hypothetical protein